MHALVGLVLVIGVHAATGQINGLMTPADTVAAFYRGYIIGDKALTERTLLSTSTIPEAVFRVSPIAGFHIVKVSPARKDDLFATRGDVEVLVDVYSRGRAAPDRMSFVVRRDGREWKIAAYSALKSEE